MALAPKLDRLVERYSDVLLRKVDIVNWQSEAAKQAHTEFELHGIPYVRVYGKKGGLLGEVKGADISAVEAAVRKGAK